MEGTVRRGFARAVVSVLVALLAGGTLVLAPRSVAHAAFPGINGLVAFQSDRDGHNEIYVMNAGGANQTRLTDNVEGNSQPSWSPDGTKIVFSSNRDGNAEIYVMDANGANQIRLT